MNQITNKKWKTLKFNFRLFSQEFRKTEKILLNPSLPSNTHPYTATPPSKIGAPQTQPFADFKISIPPPKIRGGVEAMKTVFWSSDFVVIFDDHVHYG